MYLENFDKKYPTNQRLDRVLHTLPTAQQDLLKLRTFEVEALRTALKNCQDNLSKQKKETADLKKKVIAHFNFLDQLIPKIKKIYKNTKAIKSNLRPDEHQHKFEGLQDKIYE